MFTKPAGEDGASPLTNVLDAGATRITETQSLVGRMTGAQPSGRSLAMAGMAVFFVIRALPSSGAHLGSATVRLSAATFLLGYGVVIGLGRLQRQREAAGLPHAFAHVENAGVGLHLLRKVMWFCGRWWGMILLLLLWPFIYAGLTSLFIAWMPIVLGVSAFSAIWTFGNRLLREP